MTMMSDDGDGDGDEAGEVTLGTTSMKITVVDEKGKARGMSLMMFCTYRCTVMPMRPPWCRCTAYTSSETNAPFL